MIPGLALAMCVSMPAAAFAEQSPTFAYSAEEWATLRDNNLDFNEIDKLIHEYNPTVLKNAISYSDFIGKTSTDIAESYYDAAEKIYNAMSYPDEESPAFASGVTAYLNSEIQYENLREQGDNNTNDQETYRLNYAKEEATLAKQAKLLMINYWSSLANLQTYKNNIETAQANLDQAARKVAAGTATESSRITAEQSLTTAQTALKTAETGISSTKEELCLMLGWDYGADVNIGALPEVTAEQVAAIDLAADIVKAKANNYSLLSTTRQLSNAQTSSVRETLTNTKATSEQNIASNVADLYTTLNRAVTELNAAEDTLKVQATNLAAAERKKAAGTMTEKDYNSAALAYSSAETAVQVKKYAVLTAYVNYEAAVGGLAAT